jgi:hypothetical protein
MPDFLNQQNLILILGVIIIAAPVVAKGLSLWVSSLIWKSNVKQDFEIQTVVQLMELRNALDREGAKNASTICKDLTFAIVYGDSDKKAP